MEQVSEFEIDRVFEEIEIQDGVPGLTILGHKLSIADIVTYADVIEPILAKIKEARAGTLSELPIPPIKFRINGQPYEIAGGVLRKRAVNPANLEVMEVNEDGTALLETGRYVEWNPPRTGLVAPEASSVRGG